MSARRILAHAILGGFFVGMPLLTLVMLYLQSGWIGVLIFAGIAAVFGALHWAIKVIVYGAEERRPNSTNSEVKSGATGDPE